MRSLRILQGLVLVCILLVPIFIFLFLKGFGNNTYNIPVYFEKVVDNPFRECPVADTTQHYIPEFSFTIQEGETVAKEEVDSKKRYTCRIPDYNFRFIRSCKKA